MTGDRIEAELKYAAADERPLRELESAASLGPAQLGPPRTVAELDRYLDTADLRLAAAHWACRLRTREGTTIVSLKGPAEHRPGDSLHRRPELEGPADSSLVPSGWPGSAARKRLLTMTGGAGLAERLSLEQLRTERRVRVGSADVGILSLDRVRVMHAGAEVGRLNVVELELLEQTGVGASAIGAVGAALEGVTGLTPDPMSKLEHALALRPNG